MHITDGAAPGLELSEKVINISKMYSDRRGNIPAYRGCGFNCVYCAFKRLIQFNRKCPKCAAFEPHAHLEALNKKPLRTPSGTFVTIGLSGDISFATKEEMDAILQYCRKWSDRTFLLQSKNPAFFLDYVFSDNVVLGTTIETDRDEIWKPVFEPYHAQHTHYNEISKAPLPSERAKAMEKLQDRKFITIEPILFFDDGVLGEWISKINPEAVYIGFDSGDHKLPEPSLDRTLALIGELSASGIEVRKKLIREAWWEDGST